MADSPLTGLAELLAWQASPPESTPASVAPAFLAHHAHDDPGRPKLLVCHDYKGGYTEDAWADGGDVTAAYRLSHWRHVDIFVYFSHHLVTVPPRQWVRAAHLHGVKVLGTFITEWDAGKAICCEAFASANAAERCAAQLAAIAAAHNFQGWLINVENEVPTELIPNLLAFLRRLTQLLHKQHPGNLCLWYDAVTVEGKLQWQDTLNELNQPFFEATDGLFVNYCWKDHTPREAAALAGERRSDVYFGVDVFGRGTFGGGGMNSGAAVSAAQAAGASAALFAPGWTAEHGEPAGVEERQEEFWHGIAAGVCSPRPPLRCSAFHSTFDQGCGHARFDKGRRISTEPWFNLEEASQQPLQQRFEAAGADGSALAARLTMGAAFLGGYSLHIAGTLAAGAAPLQLALFETDVRPPLGRADSVLRVSYTVACHSAASGICLLLGLAPEEGGDAPRSHLVLCSEAGAQPLPGVVGPIRWVPAHSVSMHPFDSAVTSDACRWTTRQFQVPCAHSAGCRGIASINALCYRADGARGAADFDAHLGMISIGNTSAL